MTGITRILVGVDGSKCSNEAVRYAAEISKKFEATVTLIHTYRPPESTRELPAHEPREQARVKLDESKKIMDEMGVACKSLFSIGNPASTILEEAAKGYDLSSWAAGAWASWRASCSAARPPGWRTMRRSRC